MSGHRLFLLALCLGTFLNPLNSSMIAVALVAFREDFDLTVGQVTWVVTVFYIASASVQPVFGRIADQRGPRRMFLAGMATIAVGSVVAATATSWVTICLARVVVAGGTSAAFPAAVAMIGRHAPVGSRPSMLARLQLSGNLGVSIGPVIGGVLLAASGWRVIFLLSVPIAFLASVGVLRAVPRDERHSRADARTGPRQPLDRLGVVLLATALTAALLALLGTGPLPRVVTAAVALFALAALVRVELHHAHPAMDLRAMAASPVLLRIYPAWLLLCVSYYVVLYGLPQMLEDIAGLSTATVGAAMFPLAVVSAAVTPVVTWSMRHWGAGRIVTIGAALSLASCGAAALLVTAPSLAIGVTSACVLGLSNGVVSIAISQRVFEASDPSRIGASAGLFQSVRYVGAIAAAGLLGLVFDETASVNGWAVAVLVTGLCCIYAWVLAGRSSR